MQLFVGLTTLTSPIERYAERFDLLELRFEAGRTPGIKALRRMRGQAPEAFRFSLLVPPKLSSALLESPDAAAGLVETAKALDASFIVLQTGPEVGPSARGRGRIASLAERIAGPSCRVAWEPRGPWEAEVASALAERLGIVLVEDLSMVEHSGGELVYTRLRVQGPGAALRGAALAHLAEELETVEKAYVVLEGRGNPRARARIEQALGLGVDAQADDDEEDEEADGVEDETGAVDVGRLNGFEVDFDGADAGDDSDLDPDTGEASDTEDEDSDAEDDADDDEPESER